MITGQCTSVRRALKKCAWPLHVECVHSTTRCFRSRRSTCVGVSTPIDSWAGFGLIMGKAEREARGTKWTELNKVDDDVHVIVIGKRSGKLCRCFHFYLQFSPSESMGLHAQISGHLCASHVLACHSHDACAAQCPQLLSSSQGESHHQVCEPSRKCHWGRWCSCTRKCHKGVAYDVCFLRNMTSIFVTSAEQCLTTDMIAHETGTAPSSQCQTCCVARNFSHRMAKRWNRFSDGDMTWR